MSESNKYTTNDLLDTALQKKPGEFADMFSNLITAKMRDAIDHEKERVAAELFVDAVEDEVDNEAE